MAITQDRMKALVAAALAWRRIAGLRLEYAKRCAAGGIEPSEALSLALGEQPLAEHEAALAWEKAHLGVTSSKNSSEARRRQRRRDEQMQGLPRGTLTPGAQGEAPTRVPPTYSPSAQEAQYQADIAEALGASAEGEGEGEVSF